jgi:hypothetical protein
MQTLIFREKIPDYHYVVLLFVSADEAGRRMGCWGQSATVYGSGCTVKIQ